MAAATGATSRPMTRSLSLARLMAASSSGTDVGSAVVGGSLPVAFSAATAGLRAKLLTAPVNRRHGLASGRSSPAASGVTAGHAAGYRGSVSTFPSGAATAGVGRRRTEEERQRDHHEGQQEARDDERRPRRVLAGQLVGRGQELGVVRDGDPLDRTSRRVEGDPGNGLAVLRCRRGCRWPVQEYPAEFWPVPPIRPRQLSTVTVTGTPLSRRLLIWLLFWMPAIEQDDADDRHGDEADADHHLLGPSGIHTDGPAPVGGDGPIVAAVAGGTGVGRGVGVVRFGSDHGHGSPRSRAARGGVESSDGARAYQRVSAPTERWRGPASPPAEG